MNRKKFKNYKTKKPVDDEFITKELNNVKSEIEELDIAPTAKLNIPQITTISDSFLNNFWKFISLSGLVSIIPLLYSFSDLIYKNVMFLISYPLQFINWNSLVYPFASIEYVSKRFASAVPKNVVLNLIDAFEKLKKNQSSFLNFFGSADISYRAYQTVCDLIGCNEKNNIINLATSTLYDLEEKIKFATPTVYFLENFDKVKDIKILTMFHAAADSELNTNNHMYIFNHNSLDKVTKAFENIFKDEYYGDYMARLLPPDSFINSVENVGSLMPLVHNIPIDNITASEPVLFDRFKDLTIMWYKTITDYLYSITSYKNVAILLGVSAALYLLNQMYKIYNQTLTGEDKPNNDTK
jgi:hypothetical protein